MGNEKEFGKLLMGFVLILIGTVLFSQLADNIFAAVTLKGVINETMAVSTTPNTILREDIVITSGLGNTNNLSVVNVTFFGNLTHNTSLPTINVTSEVNFTKDGVISVSGLNFTDGTYNISYVYLSDGTGNTANEDVVSVTDFGNSTISTDDIGIAIGSEVNFTKAGVITFNTLNFTDGNVNITYDFEGTEYVTNATARVLLPIINIFFALAVFLIGVMVAWSGLKGMGLGL